MRKLRNSRFVAEYYKNIKNILFKTVPNEKYYKHLRMSKINNNFLHCDEKSYYPVRN